MLKARQLGCTWLCLGYALWLMLFRPAATVLLFSRREDEALYLLGDERLRGMYDRLPKWLQAKEAQPDGARAWALANGSICRAFPTTAGDGYTATLAIVDEADLCPDLGRLMRSVKPTIDGGGRMILLSRPDKSQPMSEFKKIYRAARQGGSPWHALFLPWMARPERTPEWYEEQRRDIVDRTGSTDDLHEQYPATEAEALAPRSLDKRIAPAWLEQCYREQVPLEQLPEGSPSIPGLEVYRLPEKDRVYVIGADPAEGNPTSDDSALSVIDARSGEECATLASRLQPSVFASYIQQLSQWYRQAPALVERNNHGHAVILWLESQGRTPLLCGHDGRVGWLESVKGKALLLDVCADAFRNKDVILHSFASLMQLQSIEGSTLRAPAGEKDDRAIATALALVAAPVALMTPEDEETVVVTT